MKTHDRLEAVIGIVMQDDHIHARWLNTFSFLEYIGFRKIVKSQRAEVLNRSLLVHALEEGRHALLLKKLAVKLGGSKFDFYRPEGGGLGGNGARALSGRNSRRSDSFYPRAAPGRAEARLYLHLFAGSEWPVMGGRLGRTSAF